MSDQTEFAVEAVQQATRKHNLDGGTPIDDAELRQLVEVSTELLAVSDFDGYFQLLNPVWERVLGYSRDELRSKPFIEFVHPDDRDKTEVTAERIQPGLDLMSFTNRYIAKDGSVHTLQWRGIVDAEKRRYYTSARDMSETLAAREQVAALDSVCDLSPDAIVMQDAAGTITRWDGAAPELFGYADAEMLGQPLSKFLSLAQNGVGIDLLQLAEDGMDENVEAWFKSKPGDWIEVLVNIREFGNGATPVTGAVARVARA
jgi:PAS domain S-box-containing protein